MMASFLFVHLYEKAGHTAEYLMTVSHFSPYLNILCILFILVVAYDMMANVHGGEEKMSLY